MTARMPIVLAGLLGLLLPASDSLSASRHTASATPAKPAAKSTHATKPAAKAHAVSASQAVTSVLNRAELRQLSDRTTKSSGGKVRLAVMLDDNRPSTVAGVSYWRIGVFESHDTHLARVGTLMVRVRDGYLAAENTSGHVVTFRDWVAKSHLTYKGQTAVTPPAKKAVAGKTGTAGKAVAHGKTAAHGKVAGGKTTVAKSTHKAGPVEPPKPGFLDPSNYRKAS